MTDWTTTVYALLPHPNQPLVLVQRGLQGLELPNIVSDKAVGFWDTFRLKPMLDEKIGIPVNILRYVARHRDEESHQIYSIQLLEPRTELLPANVVWKPLDAILASETIPSVLLEGLQRWQAEQQSGLIPNQRAPWALPGWYTLAENWIVDQCARLGRGVVQEIIPVKSWSISCVLKVKAESGLLYFKVAQDLPLFVNEGPVMTALAGLYPNQIPMPVAVQPEEGWMLLDDFGDKSDDDLSLDERARLLQDFARLQLDSSAKVEILVAAGCKDRRLDVLLSQIEPLLNDEIATEALNHQEREGLKQIGPRLRELIVELVSLPIPYTILHGDLHSGNVIPHKNSFLYFDWTDAAVSHPFFDMIHIFGTEDEEQKATLRDAYLRPWEDAYAKHDVSRAWELASVLHGFYHAVSYQYIVHGIEDLVRPELNFAYYFLRKLLTGLSQLDYEQNA